MGLVFADVRSTHFQSSPQNETSPWGAWNRREENISVRTKFCLVVKPDSTLTPLRSEGRRAGEVAFTLYHPGTTCSTLNLPWASVITRSVMASRVCDPGANGPVSRT